MNWKYSPSNKQFYKFVDASLLPSDVVDVTDAQRLTLLKGIAQGGVIQIVNGTPTVELSIKAQIDALEITATPRRMREATLGIDNGWLQNLNAQIVNLRSKLT